MRWKPTCRRRTDLGILGTIVPTVDDVFEARDAARYARFPPIGRRSQGGSQFWNKFLNPGETYRNSIDDNVLSVVMIETVEGVDNAYEIAAMPGIDVVILGNSDLTSFSGFPQTDDKYQDLLTRVRDLDVQSRQVLGQRRLSVRDRQSAEPRFAVPSKWAIKRWLGPASTHGWSARESAGPRRRAGPVRIATVEDRGDAVRTTAVRRFVSAAAFMGIVVVLAALLRAQAFDLVIANGRVVDPESGLDAVRNVGISGRTIAAISADRLNGRTSIDASGLVVSPGFIDLHAHGQTPETYRFQARDGVTTALELEVGSGDIAAWYGARKSGALINYGVSIGHIPVRMAVLGDPGAFLPTGDGAHRAASPLQIKEIVRRLADGLKNGAVSIGAGFPYTPAATEAELLEVFRVSRRQSRADPRAHPARRRRTRRGAEARVRDESAACISSTSTARARARHANC